jgi:hypothetical protein
MQVARDLGVSCESLRTWIKRADLDAGRRTDGLTTDERDELRRLFHQAYEQARRYVAGVLAGFEVASRRYLITPISLSLSRTALRLEGHEVEWILDLQPPTVH